MRLKRISKSFFFETIDFISISARIFFSEERCEPSNPINRNRGINRHCPDLNTWEAFKNYEIMDGLGTLDDLKPNIKLPKLPRIPTADEVGNRVYNKVTGLKKRTIITDDDDE